MMELFYYCWYNMIYMLLSESKFSFNFGSNFDSNCDLDLNYDSEVPIHLREEFI